MDKHVLVEIPTLDEIENAFLGDENQIEFVLDCLFNIADWYLVNGNIYVPYSIPEAFGIYADKDMVIDYDLESNYVYMAFRRFSIEDGFYSA